MELHGGTIHASSAGVGQGATFTVRLPRASEQELGTVDDSAVRARPETPGQSAPAPSLGGVSILLVDDEEDTLTMFREVLEGAGAHVRAVSSAADAVRETGAWRPDVLVTDLGLPGMGGYELLWTLRARTSHRPFPAVAVSAYARLDDRTRPLAAGFRVHVSKPIDPAALVRLVGAAVSPDE